MKKYVTLLLLLTFAFAATGCDERIRKKFVRKKDAKPEEIDVVYAPVEYTVDEINWEEKYQAQFSIWRAWYTDLLYALDHDESLKRKKHLFNEMLRSARGFNKFLPEEDREYFDSVIQNFVEVGQEFDKPRALQQSRSIRKDLEFAANDLMSFVSGNRFSAKEAREPALNKLKFWK